jgi:hypothetical protein
MNAKIIISKTAKARGFVSDKYKSVVGLTEDEKKAVLNGQLVFVTGAPPHINGVAGITYRKVVAWSGGYDHRLPSPEEQKLFETEKK